LEESDIQEFLNSHAAEFPEKDVEQLTVLSKPGDEDSVAVLEEPQCTAHAFKHGLQMADDFVNFFFRNVTCVNGEDLF
jgi:hypothetical protein